MQWTSGDGKVFTTSGTTIKELPPAYFDCTVSPEGAPFFMRMQLKTEELLRLPDSIVDEVIKDIEAFWTKAELYEKAGLIHRRGIMLYGEPGGGKTSVIRLIVNDVIERGGIGLNFNSPEIFLACSRALRDVQPTTPIVVVMEDLDAIVERVGASRVLNILDGVEAIEHVVFLASTNFPQDLGPRFTDRPSRFDKRFQFGRPSAEARLEYVKHITKGFEGVNHQKIADDTEGLGFPHIKELFISTTLLGSTYEDALATIRAMRKSITSDVPKGGEMGFRSFGAGGEYD